VKLAVERETAALGVKLPEAMRAIGDLENVAKLPASHNSEGRRQKAEGGE
jgi:hypothetical protein